MFLTVSLLEGQFVVDPGFGGLAAIFPVPLEDKMPSPARSHRMIQEGVYWSLQTLSGKEPASAWVSLLEDDNPADFEMANHFAATHPSSPFRNMLMMSLFTKDGRVTLMNRNFTIQSGDSAEKGEIGSRSSLRAFITEHFGFDFPEVERLRLPFIPEWS
jgi:N-hydroxyarylamine O-acetyltransferase